MLLLFGVQAAAADAGGVPALLELVDVGSTRQRTWAFNTLGRLCFDHAENAREVCESRAIEAAVENVIGRPGWRAGTSAAELAGADEVDVSLALKSNDHARVKDKSAYLLGNLAARPASHVRLLASGAADAAVAVLRALNLAREQGIPEPEIHAAFIARSVGLLTNLSVHEVSRAAVRAAGALDALQRVAREPGHDNHRPASAAIACANLCSDSTSDPDTIPQLDPMPSTVLEYVVKALSSAVKREKYMGNVYYTPWKVAMGVRNLAAINRLNLQRLAGTCFPSHRLLSVLCAPLRISAVYPSGARVFFADAGAVEHLVEGLSFDERSAHHCSLALYELCVGDARHESELWPPPPRDQRPLTVQLRVQRTLTPLVVAQQRVAWARLHLPTTYTPSAVQDRLRAPLGASELLSADIVESVGRWVSAVWCSRGSTSAARSSGIRAISSSSSSSRRSGGITAQELECVPVPGPTASGGAGDGWLGSDGDFELDEQLRVGAVGRCAHRTGLVSAECLSPRHYGLVLHTRHYSIRCFAAV